MVFYGARFCGYVTAWGSYFYEYMDARTKEYCIVYTDVGDTPFRVVCPD
jgi:hypothetical protein